MNILFNDIAEESRRHTEEEDSKAECPFASALGEADVVTDILTEDRPAVNGTDTAMEKECGDSRADPLIGAPAAACSLIRHNKNTFRIYVIDLDFHSRNTTEKPPFRAFLSI